MMSGIDLTTLNSSQLDVVRRLDEPLFVAAGAGSGKTYTLTARLVHALSEGSAPDGGRFLESIDQALVITFTKAAALEIKDRVRGALRTDDDPFLQHESLRVDDAWISTIHGMCSRILKRHCVELGVDPAFELCEDTVREALLARAMDEVVSAAENDERYAALLREYPTFGTGLTDALSITGMIYHLVDEAKKSSTGFDSLYCPSSHETRHAMARLVNAIEALAAQRLTPTQAAAATKALSALSGFCSLPPTAQVPEAAVEALQGLKLPGRLRKDLAEFKADAEMALAEACALAHYERVQEFAPQLIELARAVDARFTELKHERSFLDNDDLIGLTLRLVEDFPEVTQDLAGRFRLVMIDEFQDTDAKQLRLISLLAGPDACRLTTVGDAQQAIYRFRGGDVRVFRSRGRMLPDTSQVRMDVNYRSDHHVLAAVERSCGDAGIVDDFLRLAGKAGRRSRYAPAAEDAQAPRIFFEIVQGGKSDVMVATSAAQVADRLGQLVDAGVRPQDMALLLGRTTNVSFFLDALRARGLAAVVTGGSSFAAQPEVTVIQALLHALANPADTEAGLFRLLSSDMFGLDADDFCELATVTSQVGPGPCKRSLDEVFTQDGLTFFGDVTPSERLRRAHWVMRRAYGRLGRWGLADICQTVVEESGWLARLERQGTDGLSVVANVLAAIRYVRELTLSLGLGASRAASEFDQWLQIAKLTPKGLAGDVVEAVQVMTIHGSKGLQFPVTVVAECWSDPKIKGKLAVGEVGDRRVVCVMPRPDANKFKGFSSLVGRLEVPERAEACSNVCEWALFLNAQELHAQAGDMARLLYVALTRAEEALVVSVPVASAERYRSELAMRFLAAFDETGEAEPGEHQVPIVPARGIECEDRVRTSDGADVTTRTLMPVAAGRARVVALRPGPEKGDPWQASSAGSLAGFDGELPISVTLIPQLGTMGIDDVAKPAFDLFNTVKSDLSPFGWHEREGFYSYSHIRRALRARECLELEGELLPSEEEVEAMEEGAPYTSDSDKATALGSCFHALAEVMARRGCACERERIDRLADVFRLSDRQRVRLVAALRRWEESELRKEALSYSCVRPEVRFVLSTPESEWGDQVEGAIDLLCADSFAQLGHALVIDYKTGDLDLDEDEVTELHEGQAHLYAQVLLKQGFSEVECAFICVETGVVARYLYYDSDETGPVGVL